MRLALYQPDIPQNAGTLLRLGACLGVAVDIIEPCGFIFDDQRLRRSAMDYLGHAEIIRHKSWQDFLSTLGAARLVLLSVRGASVYSDKEANRWNEPLRMCVRRAGRGERCCAARRR